MKKLAQITEVLAAVRNLLDGGYHYSSPCLRSDGDSPDLAPPMVREKGDALGLLGDIVSDLTNIALLLDHLDDRARELQLDTKLVCGVDVGLYTRVYDQLSSNVAAAVKVAADALAANGESAAKPERRKGTRTPRASAAVQTTLNVLETERPTADENDHASPDVG